MNRRSGFTLVEVAIALVVMGIVLTMAMQMLTTVLVAQRRYTTAQRLSGLDAVLATFTSQSQRLPCPADGALPSTDPSWGAEQRAVGTGDCLNNQQRGVVPWATLGISQLDATDGFYSLITYRVAPGLTRSGAMSFVDCDPAGTATASGTAPNQTCRSSCNTGASMSQCTGSQAIVASRGLQIQTTGGTIIANPSGSPATGAAYVLISHGENRAGAYSPEGVLQETAGATGTGELHNSAAAVVSTYYVDDAFNGTTAAHFDDVLARPTILTVATKAALAPRAH